MTATHWMRIAALASAMGLTGAAIAMDTDRTTSGDDRSSVSTREPPAAGAIVMPEDKASGMNEDGAHAGDRKPDFNGDQSMSNDDELSVNPGPSNDDMSVNPGTANDDITVNPEGTDRGNTSRRFGTPASRGSEVAPAR